MYSFYLHSTPAPRTRKKKKTTNRIHICEKQNSREKLFHFIVMFAYKFRIIFVLFLFFFCRKQFRQMWISSFMFLSFGQHMCFVFTVD